MNNSNRPILLSGSDSGFGAFIKTQNECIFWTRRSTENDYEELVRKGVDIIIHTAFNSKRSWDVTSENMERYFSDNVSLTERLIKIPHRLFIYISTDRVYPDNGKLHDESEVIVCNQLSDIYGLTKLIAESIVTSNSNHYLILRCSTMLGQHSRPNNLSNMLTKKAPVTLTGDSYFNYVLHSQVYELIEFAIRNELTGVYNVASPGYISLQEIAATLQLDVTFGTFNYPLNKMNNKKLSDVLPIFKKTTQEVLQDFVAMYRD
jgi:dTDP-4-dehydrorhamnose reductase